MSDDKYDLKWQPTPEAELFKVYRFDAGDWTEIKFEDLKVGDVYKTTDQQGVVICPISNEPDDSSVARCMEAPHKNYITGQGWQCMVDLMAISDLKKEAN